ncbi:putative signal transducing protein [Luteimonas sp. SDU101]|uniref:putative signal transducing protein n=1 Tax=Luteimonas sp. SDU101 TaxID=3422593 RepID=UPI003EBAB5F4
MFTTVASYLDPIQAQIARGLLQSEGIEAQLGDEHLALANWEWRLAIGGTRLRVAEADAARARAILQALDAGEYAIDDEGAPADAALRAPDRESPSSRLAWVAMVLLNIPLPWRRRTRSDAQREA